MNEGWGTSLRSEMAFRGSSSPLGQGTFLVELLATGQFPPLKLAKSAKEFEGPLCIAARQKREKVTYVTVKS